MLALVSNLYNVIAPLQKSLAPAREGAPNSFKSHFLIYPEVCNQFVFSWGRVCQKYLYCQVQEETVQIEHIIVK